MRARISGGLFILGVLLFTMDPLAGQPGGGKEGKRNFQFQPGTFPQGGGGFPQGGAPPQGGGGFPQGGGNFRMQVQPGGGFPQGGGGFPQGGGAFPQGGGGFPQGGGGGRRNPFDPESQWATLLQQTGGTDSVDFSRLPPDTRAMSKWASDRFGTQPYPESGVMSKDQFLDFANRNAEMAKAKMAGGPPGAAPGGFTPPGGQPGYGQQGNFQGPPGQNGPGMGGGKGFSDDDILRMFKERDRNQDGRLDYDEASDKTRQAWAEIDVNRRGYVDFDEYKGYIQRRFGGGGQGGPPQYGMQPQYGNDYRGTGEAGGPGYGGPGRREEKKDDFTNVGIRYGKLPPGLPDWFAECDQDKDGQVNMYEWRTVKGESVAAFREKDANGDGFIAPLELIRVESTKAEYDRLMAIQEGETPTGRGKSGSMSGGKGSYSGYGGGETGKGGPMMMGKGGPMMMGKGGPTSDPRSGREEKRDERVGEKMDRGKNNPFANGGKK